MNRKLNSEERMFVRTHYCGLCGCPDTVDILYVKNEKGRLDRIIALCGVCSITEPKCNIQERPKGVLIYPVNCDDYRQPENSIESIIMNGKIEILVRERYLWHGYKYDVAYIPLFRLFNEFWRNDIREGIHSTDIRFRKVLKIDDPIQAAALFLKYNAKLPLKTRKKIQWIQRTSNTVRP
jgi:uncharacterized protein Usg